MPSSPSRRPFDFSANHLALDFINTVSGRPTFTRDDLVGPPDVFEWAAGAGLLTTAEHVGASVDESSTFRAMIVLREQLYQVFGAVAHGASPEPAALAFVVRRAARALRVAQWDRTESSFVLRWQQDSLDAIGDRLADEAVQLLRSPATARIGSCAGCGWLFLDTSRAHARRWCSMDACGVRDKMRRYHQRRADVTSAGST
jgi:predicted RNA-binding Zn ribbon-like protein